MLIDIIIPTYKPDEKFKRLIEMLEKQTADINKIIVVNTEEKYMEEFCVGTTFLADHKKMTIHHISRKEFDHGRSRNYGAKKAEGDILVYMTQDAIPKDEYVIERLVAPIVKDERVACSYARQLPAADSTMAEKLTREFNYPDTERIKTKADKEDLGIKTYFCSNVCCAYNGRIFRELEGFVHRAIFNEDMIFAAKAIENGYRIAYAAKAEVIHSHNYTPMQQFHRNFDLGVSQAEHPEIFAAISSETEGIKMVKDTIGRLKQEGYAKEIPNYIVTSGCKYIGYRMGKAYRKLPMWLIRKCTMNPMYWK